LKPPRSGVSHFCGRKRWRYYPMGVYWASQRPHQVKGHAVGGHGVHMCFVRPTAARCARRISNRKSDDTTRCATQAGRAATGTARDSNPPGYLSLDRPARPRAVALSLRPQLDPRTKRSAAFMQLDGGMSAGRSAPPTRASPGGRRDAPTRQHRPLCPRPAYRPDRSVTCFRRAALRGAAQCRPHDSWGS
jgi:hypothetical protein